MCMRAPSSAAAAKAVGPSALATAAARSSAVDCMPGIRYPAAPFSGWYMCTEVGSRDLGDSGRYDQLPVIARQPGLRMDSDRTLWKDKSMTELNLAVLHSSSEAGVTMTDHHARSARFLRHVAREQREGRACPVDWTWIVDQLPNFYRYPGSASWL
jgi:nitric-oxide synthase